MGNKQLFLRDHGVVNDDSARIESPPVQLLIFVRPSSGERIRPLLWRQRFLPSRPARSTVGPTTNLGPRTLPKAFFFADSQSNHGKTQHGMVAVGDTGSVFLDCSEPALLEYHSIPDGSIPAHLATQEGVEHGSPNFWVGAGVVWEA